MAQTAIETKIKRNVFNIFESVARWNLKTFKSAQFSIIALRCKAPFLFKTISIISRVFLFNYGF